MRAGKRRRRRTGTVSISLIVIAFMVVMAVQIYRIRQKDEEYIAREQELLQELEAQTQRESEIDELEDYMKSSEYIEDTAKTKLGLTYENEIIFKESDKE